MPRCNQSVAVAAASNRHSAENRLTELYATVLETHEGFARRILERVHLPWQEDYAVWTQEALPVSGRIDLILRGFDSSGTLATVLYAEHKEPGGGWQQGQPAKYLKDLSRDTRRGAGGRLLVVVGSRKDVAGRVRQRARAAAAIAVTEASRLALKERSPRIAFTTWQEVGGIADEAGQADGASGRDWRDAATRPDAPAAQRVLLELIWYLEEKGYAVTKPLTTEQVGIFHQAVELDATTDALTAGATERLLDDRIAGFKLAKSPRTSVNDAQYQRFVPPERSWVSRYNGKLYLGFDEEFGSDRARQSQLAASVTVELPRKQAQRLREQGGFMKQLRKRNLRFEVDDAGGYCWTSLVASELASLPTIEAQTERLADWAKNALESLLTLKPGPSRS